MSSGNLSEPGDSLLVRQLSEGGNYFHLNLSRWSCYTVRFHRRVPCWGNASLSFERYR